MEFVVILLLNFKIMFSLKNVFQIYQNKTAIILIMIQVQTVCQITVQHLGF